MPVGRSRLVALGITMIGLLAAGCTSAGEVPTPPAALPTPQDASGCQAHPSDWSPPAGAAREFRTDFDCHSVDYSEILSGGPPKDGIPAIDRPRFVSLQEADDWLGQLEPVVGFEIGGQAVAYPLQILTWHEIVNDTVAGVPVLVTFCPLCNTAMAFARTVDGRVLDFGTTGRLRYSNLILYDRQTETWWQQATGEAIAGELTGARLEFLPATIVAWSEFRSANPDGRVLSRDTGHARPYGRNPYVGYDDINSSPFLYRGPQVSDRLPPMARVLTLEAGDDLVAFPYSVLESERVVHETVGGMRLVVFWAPGTASALDGPTLAEGRDIGTAIAFLRRVENRELTFDAAETGFTDRQTGSRWSILGEAEEGPLAGSRLTPVAAVNHFWFSWAAFRPETRIYQP